MKKQIQITSSRYDGLVIKDKIPKRPDAPLWGNLKGIENFDRHLVALWKPYSAASEQYRELRTSVLDASKSDSKRVFMVSSAISGEGKTTVSINLAISLVSGLHETALLIDADLRNPNIARMLGLKMPVKGLAEYLTCRGKLEDFITKTSIPKLSVIASGLPPENPSELINSDGMYNLIQEVKHRYDNRYVIVDSPPLAPVADSVTLSSLVDGILIVVKASVTQRETVSDAIEKTGNKEKILGVVLNGYKGPLPKYKYPYAQ